MRHKAHLAVGIFHDAVYQDAPIPCSDHEERPKQTIIATMACMGFHPLNGSPLYGSTSKWIAICHKPLVMIAAKATNMYLVSACRNGAFVFHT